jgi:hypothetical protein
MRAARSGRPRASIVWKVSLAAIAALALTATWQLAAVARGTGKVVPEPQVRVTAHPIEFHGKRAVLVRNITVAHVQGVHLQVTCEQHCVRYPTPIRESEPAKGVKRFAGANWIIVAGHQIHVTVTRHGRIGRYLILGIKAQRPGQSSLVVFRSGCLGSQGNTVGCPGHVSTPPKGSPVKGGEHESSDSAAPSAPGGLAIPAASETSLSLTWLASADNVGVVGYALLRDNNRVASVNGLGYTFTGLACGHSYRLSVFAYDAAGNTSAPSSLTTATASCPPAARLSNDEGLLAAKSQYLQSPDGRYRFVMQADSNLVLYGPSGALWATDTAGKGARELRMQADGNLVIYNTNSLAVWATYTTHHYNAFLAVQNDGNVVIYEGSSVLWSTETAGKT